MRKKSGNELLIEKYSKFRIFIYACYTDYLKNFFAQIEFNLILHIKMKRIIFSVATAILLGTFSASAQVGVGTYVPDASAELEVKSATKGILIPRVQLQSTTVASPIASPAQSLKVYNTATAGDVKPGFYYWEGGKWNRLVNAEDVAQNETLTTLLLNIDGKTLEYKDERGATGRVDLSAVIQNFQTVTNLVIDPATQVMTYTNEQSVPVSIDLAAVVANNETLTTFGLNADGKNLDYKDERGNTSQVDLSAIFANFESLTELAYDPATKKLNYKDEAGTVHELDAEAIVKTNETVTTMVDNMDGTYTYKNEAGADVVISASASSWNLAGNAGTAATAKLGTTDMAPLRIVTNDTERITVTETGYVGVGVSAPTSTFATAGSESKSITRKTSSYTALDSDHTIVFAHSSPATLTLANPTLCAGRVQYIINNGTVKLDFSEPVEMAAGVTTSELGTGSGSNGGVVYGNRMLIQSDGTQWVLIQ